MTLPVSPGDVLDDKYRIERVLGSGGMGVVMEATHLQLGERVAIKFVSLAGADERSLVARFAREARAMARLKSEHVTRVFDVGQLPEGHPYLVMEFLEGQDLSLLLQEQGPLHITVAVDFVLQACEAIAEAHVHGIIHRDLKPANLFLTSRADGSPCIKVLDFGISKFTGLNKTSTELRLTRTASALGSPYYMPPEQIASTQGVDARADIWALGAIVFELLTGSTPFVADTLSHLQYQILRQDPPPLRHLRQEASPDLEAAINRCLQKEPADRFANVGELALALGPHGTWQAQVSVERIQGILRRSSANMQGSGSRPRSTAPLTVPADPRQTPQPDFRTPMPTGGPVVTMTAVAVPPMPGQISGVAQGTPRPVPGVAPTPNKTLRPWGNSQEQEHPTPPSRRWMLVLGGIVLLLGISGLTVRYLSSAGSSPTATAATQPSAGLVPPPPISSISSLNPDPHATASSTASAAPSADKTETPVSSGRHDRHHINVPPPPPPPPPPHSASTTTPPKGTSTDNDLFNMRK